MTDPLADKLKAEAHASRPTVSPLLHVRIMDRIAKTPQSRAPAPQQLHLLRWTSVAAALLLAGILFASFPRTTPPTPTPEVASLPTASDLASPFTDLLAESAPTAASLHDAQYQNLDKDARNLAHFIANQIPGFSSE